MTGTSGQHAQAMTRPKAQFVPQIAWCPRRDSNARTRLRRPLLYPLSYEGGEGKA